MMREGFGYSGRVGMVVFVLASLATSAQAVERMFEGTMHFGFGDNNLILDLVPGLPGVEDVDTSNNALPPCNAPNAVVLEDGTGIIPGQVTMPASLAEPGPSNATINFFGVAEMGTGATPSLMFDAYATNLTTAGFNNWGMAVSCPKYINLLPGVQLFRRTQMAAFTWPAAPGTVAVNGGPGLTGVAGPPGLDGQGPFDHGHSGGRMFDGVAGSIRAIKGAHNYGGSVQMLGTADTILGLSFGPAGLGLGTLPIPVNFGRADGPATPTGKVELSGVPLFAVVPGSPTAAPGGPIPTTLGLFPAQMFVSGFGFAWTTGTVTAYDAIGDFATTRTRSGNLDFDATGPSGTTAIVQMVAPLILEFGVANLPLGIAITGDVTLKFVPEPASIAMLAGGVGLVGALIVVRRRREGNAS